MQTKALLILASITMRPLTESEIKANRLRAEFQECLDGIQHAGIYAVFGHLPNPLNPGTNLKNGGAIGLPLTERDAGIIIAASHQAPFGNGEATIGKPYYELSPQTAPMRGALVTNMYCSDVG